MGEGNGHRGAELAVLVQLLGAALGLVVFFALVGALLSGVAFNELGLPAERAVSLIPKTELVAIGAQAVGPAVVYGLLASLVVALVDHSMTLAGHACGSRS